MTQIASEASQRDSALICFMLAARRQNVEFSIDGLIHSYALTDQNFNLFKFLHIINESGFNAKSFQIAYNDLFELNGVFPVLAQTHEGKWFFITGARGTADHGQITLLDPASGKPNFLIYGKDDLNAAWNGRVILLKKQPELSEESKTFTLFSFIPIVLKQKRLLWNVVISALLVSVLKLAFPFYMMYVMDLALGYRSVVNLGTLTIAMVGMYIFRAIFSFLQEYLLAHCTNRVDVYLARITFEHLIHLPIHYFDNETTGDVLSNTQQIEKIRDFLTGKFLSIFINVLTLVIYIPILFFFSWQIALLIIGSGLILAFVGLSFKKPLKTHLNTFAEDEDKKIAQLAETVKGMQTIKALALEGLRCLKWESQSAQNIKTSKKVKDLSIGLRTSLSSLQRLKTIAVIFVCVFLVFDGKMSSGSIIAVTLIANLVISPFVQLLSAIDEYQKAGISVKMLGRILNAQRERPINERGLIRPIRGEIEFENVTFQYSPTASPALRNLSFKIAPNSIVGVVGRSGSGKSTLGRLIQGFYAAQIGAVKIDGMDIREIELDHLRRNIGVVLQENFLFYGTIRENIAIAKHGATDEEIEEAAKLSGADEFIQKLKKKYETVLYENGANLSGGQRQRLAIARALITKPKILIFDEATSALDAESELIIQDSLLQIAKERTLIIISHRLSMLLLADTIFVIEGGALVGNGPHKEVIAKCPIYENLWNKQHRHMAANYA